MVALRCFQLARDTVLQDTGDSSVQKLDLEHLVRNARSSAPDRPPVSTANGTKSVAWYLNRWQSLPGVLRVHLFKHMLVGTLGLLLKLIPPPRPPMSDQRRRVPQHLNELVQSGLRLACSALA